MKAKRILPAPAVQPRIDHHLCKRQTRHNPQSGVVAIPDPSATLVLATPESHDPTPPPEFRVLCCRPDEDDGKNDGCDG